MTAKKPESKAAPETSEKKSAPKPEACGCQTSPASECGCECIPSIAIDTVRECAQCISGNIEKRLLPKCCFAKAATNAADFTFETFAKLIGDKKI